MFPLESNESERERERISSSYKIVVERIGAAFRAEYRWLTMVRVRRLGLSGHRITVGRKRIGRMITLDQGRQIGIEGIGDRVRSRIRQPEIFIGQHRWNCWQRWRWLRERSRRKKRRDDRCRFHRGRRRFCSRKRKLIVDERNGGGVGGIDQR